ncbi:dolichyl-phosphate-mannose--protein mannosyltransferase [Cellulomonas fengjieae]|uniref:Polyprenol-phosphate-mannose--protein mannosyltransferase n=1 Tax=Cellulomonas fengjieae TaxID=2819978 RepID=A0ABS3SLF5_9CELL|nr:phospholipid carrier-dependent glycosyltransferase [Cellulomonas fengjieae]MBO3086576.1 phospholipid carrier-dependent glycosyltransferase [Cellulomonas fengjieae]QVI66570.1 phospholipid carrier-dependent glycosyltransferase [Cellulomonas fengjieae]
MPPTDDDASTPADRQGGAAPSPSADETARPAPAGRTLVVEGTDEAVPDGEPRAVIGPLESVDRLRRRLLGRLLGDDALALDATPRARLLGWLWPLAVTVLAAVLRFWDLGRPHKLVFDETYYVKDAFSLLVNGYEATWGDEPNPAFEAGDTSGLTTTGSYVVHPQVGKWLIALGIQLGGGVGSSAAWRLAAAVCGVLAVLMVARIGRRLFASTALGTLAGLLMAVDGQAIVMSRISLLDPFLMFFVLAAFGALLLDRDQARRRLADRAARLLAAGHELGDGPGLGVRWWRLAAAVLLGLALGTKWSAMYFLAVFGLLSVAWDLTARRSVGVRHWWRAGILKDGVVAGVSMVGIAVVVYVASWWSWFTHSEAHGRLWAEQNPDQGVQWLPPALRSFWKYHQDMWSFHNGLETPHSYAAHPLGWIVQWRPTSFFYPKEVSELTGQAAQDACGAASCSQAIVSLGNPVLWWCAAAAVIVAAVWLLRYRDWRAGAVLSGIVAGWLPWFVYAHRTIFAFYSIAFTPWVVLTLVYVIGLVVGPKDLEPRGRRAAIIGCGVLVALIVAVSAFFYPIWTGWVVPYDFWHAHMWLRTWV